MNFKKWLLQLEALDANTKNLLAKQKAPQDELDSFIKELEDEPNLIDKPTAFQRFQAKFNIQKKDKPKDEDAQRKHFATIPNTTEEELQTYDYYKNENKDSLKEMMELLRKFIEKKIITLKIENKVPNLYRNALQGSQKLDAPDFTRFMSSLHGIQASLEQYKSKGKYFNPIEEELNHQQNLVAKGNNVWVFKGHAPDVCRIYGKGHPWCISSSTSAAYWFSYRIKYHQTQYFVFDFNKDEDDPARYVNPGVAPEGMYSEWVDARNTHSKDPEDSESEVGINGYKSINQYKKYLVSKGIPLTTWTTTPPEDWEERLHLYDKDGYFKSAKNDSDSRVFPMYLKIVNGIKDSDFDTLTDEQKKEFLLSKIEITDKQFAYAIKEFKGEYYNSLDLNGKIEFAGKTKDQEKLFKFAENPNLSDENVNYLLIFATDKDKMVNRLLNILPKLSENNVRDLLIRTNEPDKIAALIIIEKKLELSDIGVYFLLQHSINKDKIAELLKDNINKLSGNNVYSLLSKATDKDKMAELLGKDNINKLSDTGVYYLLQHSINKDKIAELLGKDNINRLSDTGVYSLLLKATDKDKMAELLGTNNIQKLKQNNISDLLSISEDKEKMAKALGKDIMNRLNRFNIDGLLYHATDRNEMAKVIIENKPELSDDIVSSLLRHATDKDKIAEILQRETDNISKLSDGYVKSLLSVGNYNEKQKMAQIINKYHTNKTPEIQKILDKYLNEI